MARILALSLEGPLIDGAVYREMYDRFGGPEAAGLGRAFAAGNLTPEEFHIATLATVEAGEEELREFVRKAGALHSSAAELVKGAKARGWMPVVLSDGPGFVADELLAAAGLQDLARHAGRARHHYRWRVRYLSPRGIAVTSGFKLSYVGAFRSTGDHVVFAGNEATDSAAATAASMALAGTALRAALAGERESVAINTLSDIAAFIESDAAGPA